MIVVADASPIRYLILIDSIGVLPELFGKIALPATVIGELSRDQTPVMVRTWVRDLPVWATVTHAPANMSLPISASEWRLHPGEYQALKIASASNEPALLLVDDATGRKAAAKLQIRHLGTVGILLLAEEQGLLNFADGIRRLRESNFRISDDVLARLLRR